MSPLSKLQCQNCSAAIVLDRSTQHSNNVICKYCGSSYQLNQTDKAQSNQRNAKLVPKVAIKPVKPDYIVVDHGQQKLRLSRRWRDNGSFALLAMAIIWNVIVFSELAKSWLEGENSSVLFLLIFAGVGMMLAYKALSELFNTSQLIISQQTIAQKTKPFFNKDDFNYPLSQVEHFEILPPPGPGLSPGVKSYRLCAMLNDGTQVSLIKKIKQPSHAIYLLREINQLTKKQ